MTGKSNVTDIAERKKTYFLKLNNIFVRFPITLVTTQLFPMATMNGKYPSDTQYWLTLWAGI